MYYLHMGTEIDMKIYFPLRGLATVLQQTSLGSTCGLCVHCLKIQLATTNNELVRFTVLD
jgi:bacterioferritin-associated ferredoxin